MKEEKLMRDQRPGQCSVNNKSIIDGSEFTKNISESFNSANKVLTVVWPSKWGYHQQYDPENESIATQGQGSCNQEDKTLPERAEKLRELVQSYNTITTEDFIDASLAFYNEFSN